ncbi:sulfite exporter TauE/SafE family protein, partial [Patescibacteria group bacterium]
MDIGALLSQIDFGTYWGIFFIGILIATTAMSTGVDGAIFWAPVLLLLYGVEPAAAVACAIFIELFGFGSGLYGYTKRKKVLFKQGAFLLIFTIPLGVLGAYISKILPINFLISIIAIICLVLAFSNFRRAELEDHHKERDIKNPALKHKKLGGFLTSIGGFFAGAIGVGIGETNNYYLLIKNKYPATFATGTTIFIIAVTDLFCSLFMG